LIIIPL